MRVHHGLATVVALAMVGLAGPSVHGAGCKAEKKGVANAVKMRHAPPALATAKFRWAECERALLTAMSWPAKMTEKKADQEDDRRLAQLDVITKAYLQVIAANRSDKRWAFLAGFAVAKAQFVLVEQLRQRPMPTVKGSAEARAAREVAYREEIAQAVRETLDGSLDGLVGQLTMAALEDSLDAEVLAEIATACEIVLRERPGTRYPVCTSPPPTPKP